MYILWKTSTIGDDTKLTTFIWYKMFLRNHVEVPTYMYIMATNYDQEKV